MSQNGKRQLNKLLDNTEISSTVVTVSCCLMLFTVGSNWSLSKPIISPDISSSSVCRMKGTRSYLLSSLLDITVEKTVGFPWCPQPNPCLLNED